MGEGQAGGLPGGSCAAKDGKSGKLIRAGELHVQRPGGREWSVYGGDGSYDEGPGEPWQLLKQGDMESDQYFQRFCLSVNEKWLLTGLPVRDVGRMRAQLGKA